MTGTTWHARRLTSNRGYGVSPLGFVGFMEIREGGTRRRRNRSRVGWFRSPIWPTRPPPPSSQFPSQPLSPGTSALRRRRRRDLRCPLRARRLSGSVTQGLRGEDRRGAATHTGSRRNLVLAAGCRHIVRATVVATAVATAVAASPEPVIATCVTPPVTRGATPGRAISH